MKQQVINYETDIIHTGEDINLHPYNHDPHQLRYSDWSLQETLEQILNRHNYDVKWVGNDPNAHILAFFYALISGCLKDASGGDSLFVKLKYRLYQESKESLSLSEQKTFVEHIRLAEFSKNVGEFLKKSRYLEWILIKIFAAHKAESSKKILSDKNSSETTRLQELLDYANNFSFLTFQLLSQKCAKIMMKKQTFYLIEEKMCYFIIEDKGLSSLLINTAINATAKKTSKFHHQINRSIPIARGSYEYSNSKEKQEGKNTKEQRMNKNHNSHNHKPAFLDKKKDKSMEQVEKNVILSKIGSSKQPIKYHRTEQCQRSYKNKGNHSLQALTSIQEIRQIPVDSIIKKRKSYDKISPGMRIKEEKRKQQEQSASSRKSIGKLRFFNNTTIQMLNSHPKKKDQEKKDENSQEKRVNKNKNKMWKSKGELFEEEKSKKQSFKSRKNPITQSLRSHEEKEQIKETIKQIPPNLQRKTPSFLVKKIEDIQPDQIALEEKQKISVPPQIQITQNQHLEQRSSIVRGQNNKQTPRSHFSNKSNIHSQQQQQNQYSYRKSSQKEKTDRKFSQKTEKTEKTEKTQNINEGSS